MKLINKLRKADTAHKTDIWHNANLTRLEAEGLVKAMILSISGCYKLYDRTYGTNLVDAIYNTYGWIPSMLINETMLLEMQASNEKKVYASFTLGLDVIEIRK